MDIQIITERFQRDVYGLQGVASNKDYVAKAFALSGKMWEIVRTNTIKNKGKNIWLYGANDTVFAGVELEDPIGDLFGLEKITITLEKYAYFKHKGSYSLIKQSGQRMTDELDRQGYRVVPPYLEIYGHWTKEESNLETELIMALG
ncbi:MAG: GyrI-like domain-containing protein [Bacteroidetes bacterium]|nr:GyrI-like domain-containing protein [Bacteroidota bacterium]